jgi:hypothetical protein
MVGKLLVWLNEIPTAVATLQLGEEQLAVCLQKSGVRDFNTAEVSGKHTIGGACDRP